MILSCNHINKAFGTDQILSDVSFHIEDQEKAAIVGINGAGKSTLLKIIVGELAADQGEVVLSKGKTLGYLAQHQDLDSSRSIYEELKEVKRPIIEMEQQIRSLFTELAGYEKRGVDILLDGLPASPMQIVQAHTMREDVVYMRDYVLNDKGDVEELCFQNVETKKRL